MEKSIKSQETSELDLNFISQLVPSKMLVTEITYLNGQVSKVLTAMPTGIDFDGLNQNLINTFKAQRNIRSS